MERRIISVGSRISRMRIIWLKMSKLACYSMLQCEIFNPKYWRIYCRFVIVGLFAISNGSIARYAPAVLCVKYKRYGAVSTHGIPRYLPAVS